VQSGGSGAKTPSSETHWIEQTCVSRCSPMYGPLIADVLMVWACLQLMGIDDFRTVGLASRAGAAAVKYRPLFKKENYRSRDISVPDPWQPDTMIEGAEFVDRLGHFLDDRSRCKLQLRNVKPLTEAVSVVLLVKRFKQLINIVLDCPFVGKNGAVCPDVLEYRGGLLQHFAAAKQLRLSAGERAWLSPLERLWPAVFEQERTVWEEAVRANDDAVAEAQAAVAEAEAGDQAAAVEALAAARAVPRPRLGALPFEHVAHARTIRAKLRGFEPPVVGAAASRHEGDVFEARGMSCEQWRFGGGGEKKRGQREELPRAAKRQVAGAGARVPTAAARRRMTRMMRTTAMKNEEIRNERT
jgi:hypothetical protein